MDSNLTLKECCKNYANCNKAFITRSPGNSTSNSTVSNKNEASLSGGAIAGISVGSMAGLGILGGAGAFFAYKVKTKKKSFY
jgi:hypothetical protein